MTEPKQQTPRQSLDEIRDRLSKSQEVEVDPSGRLVERKPSRQTNQPPVEKTILKPQRWFTQRSKSDDSEVPLRLWYRENPARLVLEKRAMQARFPQFELRRDGIKLVWYGSLESDRRSKRYIIALYYPDDFPARPPKVFPLDPAITIYRNPRQGDMLHQFNDGSLCLFHPSDRFFEINTTAATIIATTAVWLFAFENWEETGKWVGPEAD